MSELAVIQRELSASVTETGLTLDDDLTREEWAEVGSKLAQAHRASAWWIGDWINQGEQKWGEVYDEAQRITDLAYDTLAHYSYVARRFEFCTRIQNLSFRHHRAVAGAESEEIRLYWLHRAEAEGWTSRQLLAAFNGRDEESRPKRIYAGRKDKDRFWPSLKPARSYLAAWKDDELAHLNPAEAEKRLRAINEFEELIALMKTTLEMRSLRADLTADSGVRQARRRSA